MFVAGENGLPFESSGHPLIDPLVMLLSFYGLRRRSRGTRVRPDRPTRLRK